MRESETRPWGSWHVLDVGDGFKVKRLEVDPGHRISYQTHEYRSESWVVVQGIATCVVDGTQRLLGPGEIISVPLGAAHRIINDGLEKVIVVEVQLGSYTGEDDIVRLADDYGRVPAETSRDADQDVPGA